MRLNIAGIVAGTLGLIATILPWWSLTMCEKYQGQTTGKAIINYYLWYLDISSSEGSFSQQVVPPDFYFYFFTYFFLTLSLVVLGSILAITGSVVTGKRGRSILLIGGSLCLTAVILFSITVGFTSYILARALSFSSPMISASQAPSIGFIIALVAGILTFISMVIPIIPTSQNEIPSTRAEPGLICPYCNRMQSAGAIYCRFCGHLVRPQLQKRARA